MGKMAAKRHKKQLDDIEERTREIARVAGHDPERFRRDYNAHLEWLSRVMAGNAKRLAGTTVAAVAEVTADAFRDAGTVAGAGLECIERDLHGIAVGHVAREVGPMMNRLTQNYKAKYAVRRACGETTDVVEQARPQHRVQTNEKGRGR